jgi:GNAT superfamily N-acetyltransferase
MGDIDNIPVGALQLDDARAGLALSTEGHWNQTEADWRFFLEKGTVFGVRDGRHLIATAALLPYSGGNAWISMVLVTQRWRRRGIATRLIDACLDAARTHELAAWLDATPDGGRVYGPLGFMPTLLLCRLRLANASVVNAARLRAGKLDEFLIRDISAIGFDRRLLLQELAARPGSRLLTNGDAMALIRDGRTARHLGPLFADTPASALRLVRDVLAGETGPVLIDAVASQGVFLKGLTESGWIVERSFQRMRFGRATTQAAEIPFAVAGPEYG